jgi:PhzF family phenazine biosynthesis protein
MRTIEVELVDAFIDGGVGGNVAGIVLEGAAELSAAQRQDIARQAAVSETAFVLPSETADYKLEFYTPTRSIPHCGHATVGTFARLAETGRLKGKEVVNETVDGPRRIRIQDGRAFLEQVPAKLMRLDDSMTRRVVESLGIAKEHLLPDGGPLLADNGNRSIQIGIRDADVLRSIRPEMDRVRDITNHLDAVCYYAFSLTSVIPGRDATARMFGPAYGIPEESATGMAAGPLACWLDSKADGRRNGFSIEQGHMMSPASPSLILAQPERSGRRLTAMWIGGSANTRAMRRFSIA